jgi:ParB-like chromosome segregation protein Spo0J
MMKVVEGITIDFKFKNLIPAIGEEERKQLEANIVEAGGTRDPLIVWRDGDRYILIDGHNRYEICTRLELPYRVEFIEFGSKDEAADWMDRNQLGRRNLSRQDYKLLLGRRYNRAKKQGERNDLTSGQTVQKSTTAEKLAKEHGVDEKTVRRAGQFQAAAEKLGIEKEITSGEVKATETAVVKAAKTLPKEPTAKQIGKAREQVRKAREEVRKARPKRRRSRPAAEKFKAYPPTQCLQAIEFYASEFTEQCPNRAGELRSSFAKLTEPEEPDRMLDEISYYALAFLNASPERAGDLEVLLMTWVSRCKQR